MGLSGKMHDHIRFVRGEDPFKRCAVADMKTGIFPIGSITAHMRMNFAKFSCKRSIAVSRTTKGSLNTELLCQFDHAGSSKIAFRTCLDLSFVILVLFVAELGWS